MQVAIVGTGIIGLATAWHLQQAGAQLTLIDRDPQGDKASFGNAGGIAVTEVFPAAHPGIWRQSARWMLDPLGPVAIRPTYAPRLVPWLLRFARHGKSTELSRIARALAFLNERVYQDLVPVLNDLGLARELHRTGALFLYETDRGFRADADEWRLKRAHHIEAHEIAGDEARRMEPALGRNIRRAVFTPQWSHLSDPKHLVDALRERVLSRGALLVRGDVRSIVSNDRAVLTIKLAEGAALNVETAVIAAGAWSGKLAHDLGDPVLLESERGYNATIPDPGIVLERQLVFAEHKFVATPLSCGLRIGGAAEFGGLQALPNFARSGALLELARRYLPALRTDGAQYWSGHRPATPDSLPVIGQSKCEPHVFYAFGHGHLGLTQAATTGHLLCEQVFGRPSPVDLAPYSIGRFR